MAQKRMFDKTIADSDDFLEMPLTTQALYFHLNIRADDDGFVSNCNSIMRLVGAKEDDFKLLILKRYLIPFENKICVIRHWLIHNTIRKDRYNPTIYANEKNQLSINDKIYDLNDNNSTGNHLAINWQPSIEENSIEEYRVEESSKELLTIDSSNNYEMDNETLSEVCNILQKEFGRLVTPMETEKIKTWEYSLPIIKLAIAEAVTNGVFYIKYIDSILFNWKKANVRTVTEAKNYIKNFRQGKGGNENKNQNSNMSDLEKIRKSMKARIGNAEGRCS